MSPSAQHLTATVLASRTGGKWLGKAQPVSAISSLEIDSRKCRAGSLFIALPGAAADGHDFISAAAENGACAALVAQPDEATDLPQLVVADVFAALQSLGKAGRAAHVAADGRLVGITGSVGKTGSKEMLAHILGHVSANGCHASRASFNNHLGVPLTLAMLPEAPVSAVQEMGMNAAGEISALSQLACPDMAIITCIADSHMGYFDSTADIAAAKSEIFDGMKAGGVAILNRDDSFFDELCARARTAGVKRIISFGRHADADARLLSSDPLLGDATAVGQRIAATIHGSPLNFTLGMRANHWATNAMAILAAAVEFGFDAVECAEKLRTFNDLPGRGAISKGRFAGKSVTLIDDSYNAGPRSMQAALAGLRQKSPQVLVLSDMLELGDTSRDAHTALAPLISALRPRVVITIGDEMARMAANLPCAALHQPAASPDNALDVLADLASGGDTVFVKGSLGSGAWRVARGMLDAFSSPPPDNMEGGA